MTTFPRSPRLVKGGLVLMNPVSGAVERIIALQYNPDSVTRSFQVLGAGSEGADRSEALRLKGPAVETIRIETEIDATDQLEFPSENPDTVYLGIQHQLAALEIIVYPSSATLSFNNEIAQSGEIEIVPMETSLAVFVWSRERVVPVRITELSITEEAFDASLNPIRARINLSMRVLSVNDTGFHHKAGMLFMSYLQNKERLSGRFRNATYDTLGITPIY